MRFNELSGVYKKAFDFCFEKAAVLDGKVGISFDSVLDELENSEVFIESSPFFVIMNFTCDELFNLRTSKSIDIIVDHGENASGQHIPTVFIMHFDEGRLIEIEFFNADSSAMNLDEIFAGKLYINGYEDGKKKCETYLES